MFLLLINKELRSLTLGIYGTYNQTATKGINVKSDFRSKECFFLEAPCDPVETTPVYISNPSPPYLSTGVVDCVESRRNSELRSPF